jgi:hypothetical protein
LIQQLGFDDDHVALLFDKCYNSLVNHTFLSPNRSMVEKRYRGLVERFGLESRPDLADRLESSFQEVLQATIGNPVDAANVSLLLLLYELSHKPLESTHTRIETKAILRSANDADSHREPVIVKSAVNEDDDDLRQWKHEFSDDSDTEFYDEDVAAQEIESSKPSHDSPSGAEVSFETDDREFKHSKLEAFRPFTQAQDESPAAMSAAHRTAFDFATLTTHVHPRLIQEASTAMHVTVAQLLRDCCAVLRGSECVFAEWDATRSLYVFAAHKVIISHCTPFSLQNAVAGTVLPAATLLRRMQSLSVSKMSSIVSAFLHFVNRRIEEFHGKVDSFERAVASRSAVVGLMQLLALTSSSCELKTCSVLSSIWDSYQSAPPVDSLNDVTTGPHPVALLSLLFDVVCETERSSASGSDVVESLRSCLLSCVSPIVDMAHSWISNGSIHDPWDEFFVRVNPKTEDADIVLSRVPTFLHSTVRDVIFDCGRSIRIMRMFSSAFCPPPAPTRQLIFSNDQTLLERTVDDLACQVAHHRDTLSAQLLVMMEHRCELLVHFATLRAVFFMEQGDLAREFSSRVFDISTSVHRSAVTAFFVEAVDTCGYLRRAFLDNFSLTCGSSSSIGNEFSRGSSVSVSTDVLLSAFDVIDSLQLTYTSQYPLSEMLSADVMVDYHAVFRFLLRIEHAKHLVVDRARSNRSTSVTHSDSIFRFMFLHFIDALRNYVFADVIASSWPAFVRSFFEVKNLQDLDQRHVDYLKNICRQCLLVPQFRILHSQVVKLLHTAREYAYGLVATTDLIPRFRQQIEVLVTMLRTVISSGNNSLEPLLFLLNQNGYYRKM